MVVLTVCVVLLANRLFPRVSITCYVAGQNEWTAFTELFPVPAGLSPTCTEMAQICQCDADGRVAGLHTGLVGGCLEKRNPGLGLGADPAFEQGFRGVPNFELAFPTCLVPHACQGDERVASAQALISSALEKDWEQPPKYQLRECSLTEQTSDECDPEDSQLRSNLYSFATVFLLQIVIIIISKLILRCKLASTVEKANRDRIASRGTDPSLIALAEKYIGIPDTAGTNLLEADHLWFVLAPCQKILTSLCADNEDQVKSNTIEAPLAKLKRVATGVRAAQRMKVQLKDRETVVRTTRSHR